MDYKKASARGNKKPQKTRGPEAGTLAGVRLQPDGWPLDLPRYWKRPTVTTGGNTAFADESIGERRILTATELKNEQVRLFASYLNIIAAGVMVGAFVPAPLALYWGSHRLDSYTKVLIEVTLMLTSVVLMLTAQRVLRRL